MSYSIGAVAKIMGVAPSTLRYYDKEGLLPASNATQAGCVCSTMTTWGPCA